MNISKNWFWACTPEVVERIAAAMADPRQSRRINSDEDLNAHARELGEYCGIWKSLGKPSKVCLLN
jgi:hypothetical protein